MSYISQTALWDIDLMIGQHSSDIFDEKDKVTLDSIYGGFAMFTESYVFLSNHSPQDAGLTIVGYLYQQGFENSNLGFASAIIYHFLMMIVFYM